MPLHAQDTPRKTSKAWLPDRLLAEYGLITCETWLGFQDGICNWCFLTTWSWKAWRFISCRDFEHYSALQISYLNYRSYFIVSYRLIMIAKYTKINKNIFLKKKQEEAGAASLKCRLAHLANDEKAWTLLDSKGRAVHLFYLFSYLLKRVDDMMFILFFYLTNYILSVVDDLSFAREYFLSLPINR